MKGEKCINSEKSNVETTRRQAKKRFKEQLAEGIKINSIFLFK